MTFEGADERSHGEDYPGGASGQERGRQPQQPDQRAEQPPARDERPATAGAGVSAGEPTPTGRGPAGPPEAVDKAAAVESGAATDAAPAGEDPRTAPSDATRSRPVGRDG